MRRILALLAVLVLAAPALAVAQQTPPPAQPAYVPPPPEDPDFFLVPWYGWFLENGLADVSELFDDSSSRPAAYGVSFGFLNRSLLSGEIDFGYSKNYFGDPEFLGGNDLMTLTGSLIVGPWFHAGDRPIARPYGIIGGGLSRSKIEDFIEFGESTKNRGVIDYGFGLFGYFTRNIGVRVDFRWMRDVGSDESDEDGWGITKVTYQRLNVGLLLAW